MNSPSDPHASWLTPLELLVLGAIWGASFLFMRIAAPSFGPLPLVEVRLALGALVLLPFLWRERRRFHANMWWRIAGISAVNSAIPFALFAWAAERAPAGIGAISNSTTAIFAALIAFLFFGERFDLRRVLGLLAGFAGVVVLASGKTSGGSVLGAALAGTAAGLLYAIGLNLVRRYLSGLPASAIAAANLCCAALLFLPLALATWPSAPIPTRAWAAALGLGVFCSGLAFVLYYRLLYRIGAPRTATVTYLIPLFGMLWGWLLLDERLTTTMTIACALILFGVALIQKPAASR